MSSFKDAAGRQWELRITLGIVDRLRAVGLDLDKLASEKADVFGILLLERHVLGSVLWILCEKQAEKLGLTTPEEFFGDFDGATLEGAGDALLDAVLDFFPNRVTAPIKKRLTQIKERMESAADREIDRRLSALSDGGSLAKSESTPGT